MVRYVFTIIDLIDYGSRLGHSTTSRTRALVFIVCLAVPKKESAPLRACPWNSDLAFTTGHDSFRDFQRSAGVGGSD